MNGKIMTGFGVAFIAWGAIAFTYEKVVEAVLLALAGIALFVVGRRQSRKGQ